MGEKKKSGQGVFSGPTVASLAAIAGGAMLIGTGHASAGVIIQDNFSGSSSGAKTPTNYTANGGTDLRDDCAVRGYLVARLDAAL